MMKKNGIKKIFYYKDKSRKIILFNGLKEQRKAVDRKKYLYKKFKKNIPKLYLDSWKDVKLFQAAGNIDNCFAIFLDDAKGFYDVRNKLNELTGKEWTKFTCSWFIFNALPKDIKEEKLITDKSQDHPATFSPTMISNFIEFFTKTGEKVIDPFCGIGSTMVACRRTGRVGYGIELNKKYYKIIKKRVPEFKENIINDDCRNIDCMNFPIFDYSISSPPYWDMLNRSTNGFKKKRETEGRDYHYSKNNKDLGNISSYEDFINELCSVYFKLYNQLKNGAYITIILKNVKKGGQMYPLAWDVANKLQQKYVLKDEKIWIQDEIGLSPYGYPNSWASNIIHHYCLIFRKEE